MNKSNVGELLSVGVSWWKKYWRKLEERLVNESSQCVCLLIGAYEVRLLPAQREWEMGR